MITSRFLAALGVIGLLVGYAPPAAAVEAFTVQDFADTVSVNADGSFDVREAIAVDFGTNQRHGIIRTIPTRFPDSHGLTRSIRISGIDVAGDTFAVSRSLSGITVKIGDADTLVTGMHTYTIRYRVDNALNQVGDAVELYWNVTGNGWDTSIDRATAAVTLPGIADPDAVRQVAYMGPLGSTAQAESSFSPERGYRFEAARQLAATEGLTIVASWPLGIVTLPGTATKLRWFLTDNWPLGLPFLVAAFLLWQFARGGKDPRGRGTIVPEFAPPKDLTIPAMAMLRTESMDDRTLTALIIGWAVGGHLTISEPKHNAFELTKLSPPKQGSPAETGLFAALFRTGDTVRLADLKQDTQLVVAKTAIRSEAIRQLLDARYIVTNPDTVRLLYFIAGIAVVAASVVLGSAIGTAGAIGGAVSGLLIAAAAPFMPKRTKTGVDKKEQIQGFELYLKTAERYRMAFAEKERLFERYLPYAIAFGVAGLWAKAFKDIATAAPRWYSGYYGTHWSAVHFANGLGGNLTSSLSGVTTASSGGSGFSGGGSGGGFGGGGGGSW